MLTIGVVGAGYHARNAHLPALAAFIGRNPSVARMGAICDPRTDAAAAVASGHGIPSVYRTAGEMLAAGGLDAVIAVTPHAVTVPVASAVVEAGLPVLLEKPPGGTEAEAEALCDLCARRSARAMVSVNRRFAPMAVAARDALAGRTVQYARSLILRDGRHEPDFVFDAAFHPVDTLRFLLGELRLDGLRRHARGNGQAMDLSLTVAGAIPGTIEILPDCGAWRESHTLFGPGFHAVLNVFESLELWEGGRRTTELRVDEDAPAWERDGTYAETAAFLETLAGGGTLAPTPGDILPSLRFICGVEESSRAAGERPPARRGRRNKEDAV